MATTAPIEGLDMKGSIYGPIDSISNGEMTVDEWQSQLTDVWRNARTQWNTEIEA